mgnify:CR=1 FL=1
MSVRHAPEKIRKADEFQLPSGKADSRLMRRKLARIRAGGVVSGMDLFSGCGGISLGLHRSGIRMLAGMDIDLPSMRSWWWNFRRDVGLHREGTPTIDIASLGAEDAMARMRCDGGAETVDLLVGGPPCQAYSRIGKGKMASLQKTGAHKSDGRGMLFEEYLRYVRELSPVGVLIENVPDAINFGGEVIPEVICSSLADMGYLARFTVLNAANYGVPQSRERVFILAIHEEAAKLAPSFPEPTHRIARDPEARQVRHRIVKVVQEHPEWAILPPDPATNLPEAVTVFDALSDLPIIRSLDRRGGRLGCSSMREGLSYSAPPANDYQRLMREWPSFPTRSLVDGNLLRDNPRDFPVYAQMQEGDQYPEARRIHERLFMEEVGRRRARGQRVEEGDPTWQTLQGDMVPPYDDTKFESKWYKMRRDRPSRTVVAHLQMDTYTHIHYDSAQSRAVTVREAARLQSFPDGFSLVGSMKEGFRQIGNAVPPLMAWHLAQSLLAPLRSGRK